MAIKKICQSVLLSACLISMLNVHAQDSPFGQTFQINTRLNSFVGKPSWLIIIRDVQSGQVMPYLYDFNSTDNFWLGFTYGHAYQVTVSELEFGPPNATIHNFCHLQDGILDRQSFSVTVTGDLTPNRRTSFCHVFKYKELNFPIAESSGSNADADSANNPAGSALKTVVTSGLTPGLANTINNAISNGVAGGVGTAITNALTGGAR
jgi:hypothetical protein